jgi:hypothetical protein
VDRKWGVNIPLGESGITATHRRFENIRSRVELGQKTVRLGTIGIHGQGSLN